MRAAACVVALLGSVVLAGCTTAAELPGRTASAANLGMRSPAALSAVTAAPAAGILRTACGDDRRDATGHDLTGVVLTREAGDLVVAFTLAAPPASGSTFLTVELRTADGAALRRLGAELDGGRPVAAYVIAPPARVRKLDGVRHAEGAEVRATYPADVLDGLGPNWGWIASAGTGSGVDDVCPGDGSQAVNPVVVP